MGNHSVFYITTLSAFCALFATIFQGYLSSNSLHHLTRVLSSLTDLEFSNKTLRHASPHIAVGYGACTDVYVDAVHFLNATELAVDAPLVASDKITTKDELLRSFGYFFAKGAAAERLVEDKALFNELLVESHKGGVLIRKAIGLNAPGMANRFAKEGATVLLGADLSLEQKSALHKNVQLSNGLTTVEDMHLILEYKAGAVWGELEAPRANRFIIRTDHNPILKTLEPEFTESFGAFAPRLFAISGLHVMDNEPEQQELRDRKLQSLAAQLKNLPQTTLIHFEMASYVEVGYVRDIFSTVIPHTNSLGMNEQELQNLVQVFAKGEISLVADHNPTVEQTWQQTRDVFKHIRREFVVAGKSSRKLSRIHVHTLAYQLIMTVRGSDWKSSASAAAKAALTAHRYVCGTEFVNPEAAQLLLDGEFSVSNESGQKTTLRVTETEPVQCWNESLSVDSRAGAKEVILVEVCVAPVLVCVSAKWTTGAGDNISAAGLIVQI